ncbi:MAG: polysaccharide biosynthesis/export family protein [Calditrichaceae bacterium]
MLKIYNLHKFIILAAILIYIITSTSFAGITGTGDVVVGDPDEGAYPFKPGDGLAINTFPDTASFLNNVFPIDDRGFAEFPIIGKVKVTAMTKKELENYLKETFRAWLRNPNIYIKPVVRISLLGGFRRPGLYYIDHNSSLWQAVRLAGGPLLEEGIYEMKWERDGDEQKGDLIKYFESGISLRRMGFHSGDQLRTKLPDSRTAWDTVQNFLPIVSLATTVALAYLTYQQSILRYQR